MAHCNKRYQANQEMKRGVYKRLKVLSAKCKMYCLYLLTCFNDFLTCDGTFYLHSMMTDASELQAALASI